MDRLTRINSFLKPARQEPDSVLQKNLMKLKATRRKQNRTKTKGGKRVNVRRNHRLGLLLLQNNFTRWHPKRLDSTCQKR